MRVYGVDTHRATLRRVTVLAQRLPPGTWNKDQGPGSWSNEAYLLAAVVDAVNQHAWITAAVNSKRKPPKPESVKRPGSTAKKAKTKWTDLHKTLGVSDE
ncbi:MAG: hypothetical protein EBU42_10430 [Synechococcus sp.]|nr:hypothetical protein [Synechococcus sp.]